jgi:hypothetical protein
VLHLALDARWTTPGVAPAPDVAADAPDASEPPGAVDQGDPAEPETTLSEQ